jgi:tetratricopeptide (TPR) repeat protein
VLKQSGRVYEANKILQAAVVAGRELTRIHPMSSESFCKLGYVQAALDQRDEAIASFKKTIELDPKHSHAYANLGAILCDFKKDPDAAIPYFRKAIELDPSASNYYNLGNALFDKAQWDEAIKAYKKTIELKPNDARSHELLASALKNKGLLDEAILICRKAIQLNPNSAEGHAILGRALRDKGQWDEAIACFRKSIELDSKQARTLGDLSDALKGKGLLDEAIDCCRKAVALDPKNSDAHLRLGVRLYEKGQFDEAASCARTAIELDPKSAEAYGNLGFALDRIGKGGEAIDAWRQSVALRPAQPNIWYWIAKAEAGRGHRDEAVPAFRKVAELYPPNSDRAKEAIRFLTVTRFSFVLGGQDKPADDTERQTLAKIAYEQKEFAFAARLWAEVFTRDPKSADDLHAGHRLSAARAAALAAAGQGGSAAKLDDQVRSRLRQQALDWLRADRAAWAERLRSGPPEARAAMEQTLARLQQEPDLAGIRDADSLARLPEDERKAFEQLWSDVAVLLKSKAAAAMKSP